MKRFFAFLICMLLPLSAAAEEAALYQTLENEALSQGLTMETTVDFSWGSLSCLTEEENEALGSVVDALSLRSLRHQSEGETWNTLEALLQEVSVLDLTLGQKDGVYYEESSLLAGKLMTFTEAGYARFSQSLSRKTGIQLPDFFRSFAPAGSYVGAEEALRSVSGMLTAWRSENMPMEKAEMPVLMLPGVSGSSARSAAVEREELILLARTLGNEGAEEEESFFQKEETLLNAFVQALEQLPRTLEETLPEDFEAEYMEICDENGGVLCRRLTLQASGEQLLLEWSTGKNIRAMYAEGSVEGNAVSLLATWQKNEDLSSAKKTQRDETLVLHLSVQKQGADAPETMDVILESHSEGSDRKEDVQWTMTVSRMEGENVLPGLEAEGTAEIRGSGKELKRKDGMLFFVTGLAEKRQKLMEISVTTRAQQLTSPLERAVQVISLDDISDEELMSWMNEIQQYFPQAARSILAMLPEEAAVYLLSHMD